jgi:hypothetical protein
MCLLVVLLTAIPVVFMNSIYGYLPAIAVILAIAVSSVYLLLLKKSLIFEELSDLTNCRRETDIDFTVLLRNKSILVFPKLETFFYISDLFDENDTITSSVITLASKETRKFNFSIRFDHIGSYSAGLKRIVIHDMLGLFSFTIENSKKYRVNVTPKIFDVDNLRISHTALTDSEKMIVPTAKDGSDYTGVREYVWGDPIKTIHWKLSARHEGYLTKQFESYGVVGLSIVLDFYSPKYDNETLMSIFDSVVESGLSIANYAEANGMEYEIAYTNKNGESSKFNQGGHGDYSEVFSNMPRITTSSSASLIGSGTGPDLLLEVGDASYSYGNIIYISANITDEISDILISLKSKTKYPIFFAVIPNNLSEDELAKLKRPLRLLDAAGIAYYTLFSARELGGGEVL